MEFFPLAWDVEQTPLRQRIFLDPVVLNLQWASESPGGLVKTHCWAHSTVSEFVWGGGEGDLHFHQFPK